MTAAPIQQHTAAQPATFDSLDPATGAVYASFPIDGPDEVGAAVERARAAARWWYELGFDGRAQLLRRWRKLIAARITELAEVMSAENGKPHADAVGEIAIAVEHLDWATKNAGVVLGRRKVGAGLLAVNQAAHVEYVAYGVVGVIGPWNYPVHTPMGSISYALAAGNAVVFKPSEFTPAIGKWLVDTFAEAVPDHPVFQLVTGLGATGAALCQAGADKIAFTGSTPTGKKIMAACAETLTPVVIECGGKDPLIVAPDADLEKAADAAVWGGMSNAGQTCVGVERVYVVEEVADAFTDAVVRRARKLRASAAGDGGDLGPITMPAQLSVISRHIDDALARGGRAAVGGAESVHAPYVDPVVLLDVPEDSPAVQEETFGPTLTVTRVPDVAEAVRRANDSRYGLGATVFSRHHGEQIAAQLRTGMVAVNSVLSFAMVPALPFGGVRDSGFGRIHGADGLREFAWPRSVTRQRFPSPIKVTSFDRPRTAITQLTLLVRNRWGR